MRGALKKRLASTSNDSNSGGAASQARYITPTIHVDRRDSSAASLRGGIDNIEFMNDAGKETSLTTLSVDLSLRRRRKMSGGNEHSRTSQTVEEEATTYFHKSYPPIENFKKAVRLVQVLVTISEYGYKKKEADELTQPGYFTFTEYAAKEEEEQQISSDLSFDAKLFKANKEMRLTSEIKAILTKPPSERTNQQLAKVQFSLRSIQSFAEYPVRMQKKLVKVGWYERHPIKRVILRQGHPPQAFYFVLSGSAVVKIVDRQRKVARTICFLKRGDSFGELAILHDTKRQSTVISRELIELLCISKEDFIDIFMAAGGVKNINDPDHTDFISSLEFLYGWPTEELPKNPKKCLFNFFRRGAVLVRDSNYSDWIYVVKSGSCQVLKKLKKVKSKIQKNIKHKDDDSNLTLEKLHDLAVDMARKKRPQLLDRHFSAIETVASVQENWYGFTEPPMSPMSSGNASNKNTVTFADLDDENNRENAVIHSRTKFRSLGQYRSSGKVSRRSSEKELDELKRNRDDLEIDIENKDYGRGRFATYGGPLPGGDRALMAAKRAYNNNLKRQRKSNVYIQTPSSSQTRRELDSPQHKLAIIDEAAKKHEETAELTEADIDPCFVQVAVLQKGDVFGLHSMFCDGQPSLSLVSNGAECIMILKKFYLEHCTETMKGRLRKWVSPFPDDSELQSSLQDKVNWDHYKSQTFGDVLRNHRTIRRIRDKCTI